MVGSLTGGKTSLGKPKPGVGEGRGHYAACAACQVSSQHFGEVRSYWRRGAGRCGEDGHSATAGTGGCLGLPQRGGFQAGCWWRGTKGRGQADSAGTGQVSVRPGGERKGRRWSIPGDGGLLVLPTFSPPQGYYGVFPALCLKCVPFPSVSFRRLEVGTHRPFGVRTLRLLGQSRGYGPRRDGPVPQQVSPLPWRRTLRRRRGPARPRPAAPSSPHGLAGPRATPGGDIRLPRGSQSAPRGAPGAAHRRRRDWLPWAAHRRGGGGASCAARRGARGRGSWGDTPGISSGAGGGAAPTARRSACRIGRRANGRRRWRAGRRGTGAAGGRVQCAGRRGACGLLGAAGGRRPPARLPGLLRPLTGSFPLCSSPIAAMPRRPAPAPLWPGGLRSPLRR